MVPLKEVNLRGEDIRSVGVLPVLQVRDRFQQRSGQTQAPPISTSSSLICNLLNSQVGDVLDTDQPKISPVRTLTAIYADRLSHQTAA